MKQRCAWVTDDPLYIAYHDEEWGKATRLDDDQYLFEMLLLEGAQAGLSWITILKRRENYRQAFADFDPEVIRMYDDEKVEQLMQNEGIIRNRRKIKAAIQNAVAFVQLIDRYGSFRKFLQTVIDQPLPIQRHFTSYDVVPTETDESRALSKALKNHGFSFVGPVICYAFMQAIGVVNDHTQDCYLYEEA